MTLLCQKTQQVVEENLRAELQRGVADISRLEEQLARCHIQQNKAEPSTRLRAEPQNDQIMQAPQVNLEWLG